MDRPRLRPRIAPQPVAGPQTPYRIERANPLRSDQHNLDSNEPAGEARAITTQDTNNRVNSALSSTEGILAAISRLRENIASVYLGAPESIDRLIRCILARGHVLIEDVPGVGKTVLASAIARSIDGTFSRVQLTPDMLPSDVIGVTVFDREGSTFRFKPGPIFANIILADEINRTTPRTQTALLEAMSDASVSVDGVAHELPAPFTVLATQNPYEFEGTYLLPENQLDRFLMRISLGYPEASAEADMLDIRPAQTRLTELEAVMTAEDILDIQNAVDAVAIAPELRTYIVNLATATRQTEELEVGLSPRGSLALAQAARATALMAGRDYTTPADIFENLSPVCAHRIIVRGAAAGVGWKRAAAALDEIAQSVDAPR